MNEVKQPKRPLFVYYLIVLAVVLLFNLLIGPAITQRAIKEVDYGTFLSMIEEKNVGKVQVQKNQILFTDKE